MLQKQYIIIKLELIKILLKLIWLNIGLSQWTIMPDFHDDNTIFAIIHSTIVSGTMSFNYVIVARPSFYLSSSVQYDSGTGTMSDPIRLKN